jgi:hypothetical protein
MRYSVYLIKEEIDEVVVEESVEESGGVVAESVGVAGRLNDPDVPV